MIIAKTLECIFYKKLFVEEIFSEFATLFKFKANFKEIEKAIVYGKSK